MTCLAAVLVTRNRVPLLMQVLDALDSQTRRPDLIVVVDNGSTDDTAAQLAIRAAADARLHPLRLDRNLGGAGGFAEGIRRACALGADHLWLSDDDAIPRPDTIATLISALERFEQDQDRRPPFACSRVVWKDGSLCEMNTPRPVWDWPRFLTATDGLALVDSCSFVSVLIPRWAVERHGLPIAEYFIWFDDAEYTRRLSVDHPGLHVPASVILHDIALNRGVNFGLVTPDDLWKFRFGARNEASFHLHREGWISYLLFIDHVLRQLRAAKVPFRLRWPIWRSLVAALTFNPKIQRLNDRDTAQPPPDQSASRQPRP
ncbi:MAG: glycosyltransferase family 2 protein [Rhodobacteraceae bacterium]|nr:glycosyltransferase family 2 protein [Paracoccaceae bacterium]